MSNSGEMWDIVCKNLTASARRQQVIKMVRPDIVSSGIELNYSQTSFKLTQPKLKIHSKWEKYCD